MSSSINFWVGLDVHKDSITAAVFEDRDPEPLHVDRLPYDLHKIRRYFQRLFQEGRLHACYEASGAGYVFQRSLLQWGAECHLAAPSLIPRRPGDRRETDRRDAIKIGRDFRDHCLVLIHVPTEQDARARDLVRCRETFQREIVKSRHYILKVMRRRGFVFREANNWTVRHFNWIRQVLADGTLPTDDRVVDSEKIAILLRSGAFPYAYVYPRDMRSTRDLLRRRLHFARKRAELLTHVQNTFTQYNLPKPSGRLTPSANRAGLADLFDDPAVRASIRADVSLLDHYDDPIPKLEHTALQRARVHDTDTLRLLMSIHGVGKILGLTLLYEIGDIARFPSAQDFSSYGRLIK